MANVHNHGLRLALCSVALVAGAQLLLKLGVSHIAAVPVLSDWPRWLALLSAPGTLLPVAAGILCYGLSVLCWMGALARLPLSLAYPLLSLSYPLVYAGATLLPWFHETLNAQRLAGIALIMLGVALLMLKANHGAPAHGRDRPSAAP